MRVLLSDGIFTKYYTIFFHTFLALFMVNDDGFFHVHRFFNFQVFIISLKI